MTPTKLPAPAEGTNRSLGLAVMALVELIVNDVAQRIALVATETPIEASANDVVLRVAEAARAVCRIGEPKFPHLTDKEASELVGILDDYR